MTARIWINGIQASRVDARDRGLAYGDGLFETMRLIDGNLPLWSRHRQRLMMGCQRLNMPCPDFEVLHEECLLACAGMRDAVVKVVITRGLGPRGYAYPDPVHPTRMVMVTPPPELPQAWYHQGLRVHVCRTRLAVQPLLAGIKHLNRLEQVLARNEWQDKQADEGLVLDIEGWVTGATAANVFAVLDGVLVTPPVDRCGVAGVARAEVLARNPDCNVCPLRRSDLLAATEIFVSSSVRGIVPVAEIPAWQCRPGPGPVCQALQAQWVADGLVPEPGA